MHTKAGIFYSFTLVLFLSIRSALGASFLFAGDMTPAWRVDQPTRFYSDEAIDTLLRYDAFLWNCETSGPSSRLKPNRFVFTTDAARLTPLLLSNSVAIVANNHFFDGYAEGAANLLHILNENMIPYAGVSRGLYRGAELAFAAATHLKLATEERGVYVFAGSPMLPVQFEGQFGVPRAEEIAAAIRLIRAQDTDSLIFVYIHDGVEAKWAILQRQLDAALLLAAAGADAVFFAHGHIALPAEYIGNTLVGWGLGNAIFGGNMNWRNHTMNFLEVTVDAGRVFTPAGQGPSRVKHTWKPFYTSDWLLRVPEPVQ